MDVVHVVANALKLLVWILISYIPYILNKGKPLWECHFNGLVLVHGAKVYCFAFGFVFGGTMASFASKQLLALYPFASKHLLALYP
jgi:hypothetical protein